MSAFMIGLSIVILFLGFTFSSNKYVTALMLFYMWILFAFNTVNGDYVNYVGIYTRIGNGYIWTISHYEIGFVALCKLCAGILHLKYADFIILMATLSIILFWIVIKQWTEYKHQNIVISLFIIVLYWMMICQYRFYIGFLLSLIGLYYLLNNEGISGYIRFGIFIVLGISMHYSIALFALMIFVKKINLKYVVFFTIGITVILMLMRTGALSSIIIRFVPEHKIEQWIYLEGNRSILGILFLVSIRVLLIIIEYIIMKKDTMSYYHKSYIVLVNNIFKITAMCSPFIVLETFNKNFERLFRLPLFLAIILFSHYLSEHRVNMRKVPLLSLASYGYIFLYMISFYISFGGWFEHNLVPILTYNSLIGY